MKDVTHLSVPPSGAKGKRRFVVRVPPSTQAGKGRAGIESTPVLEPMLFGLCNCGK